MASGWKHDINQNCYNISPGNVDIQNKNKKHPHNIFLRSLKWNTFKSWRISMKKQLGKRRLQHCCYTSSWSMTKNFLQEQDHLLQVFGLFITLSLKQRPFFSDRLTHCRIRQTSVLTRTVLCQFHAKDRFKVLANYHHMKLEKCCKVTDIN